MINRIFDDSRTEAKEPVANTYQLLHRSRQVIDTDLNNDGAVVEDPFQSHHQYNLGPQVQPQMNLFN